MANESTSATKIAIGVAVGVVVGGLLLRVCERALDKRDLEQELTQIAPAQLTQQQIEDIQRPQYRARAEQLAADIRLQKRAAEAQDAAASAAATNGQHNLAWQRYYQRPKECDNPPNNQALVECGNRAIRARAEFDRLHGT